MSFCCSTWRGARCGTRGQARSPRRPDPSPAAAFAAGAALSLSNPQNVAFWLGVGGGAVTALGAHRPQLLVIFFVAFMLACVVWCFFMAGMIAGGRKYLSARFYRWINLTCGLAMAYFGVRLLALLTTPAR